MPMRQQPYPMRSSLRVDLKNFIISVAALVVLWLGWLIACALIGNEYILPSFPDTMRALWRTLGEGDFWRAFAGTLLRTLWAFLCSFAAGTLLALCARLRGEVRAFLAPVVSIVRTVPTMAVILALLLWTTPSVAPVIVSVLVLLPAVYAAALAAFDEAEEGYGRLCAAYRVSVWRRIGRMYLPLAMPSLLAQAGGILSMGLKITISAEVLANTYRSLGGMMQEAKMFVDAPTLLALTLLAVVLGFALEGIFAFAARLVVRWRS